MKDFDKHFDWINGEYSETKQKFREFIATSDGVDEIKKKIKNKNVKVINSFCLGTLVEGTDVAATKCGHFYCSNCLFGVTNDAVFECFNCRTQITRDDVAFTTQF